MTLYVYNTMSRKKEVFRPMTPGKVNMYVCGPTVYDYIHIGNARPMIFFDVVRRYFKAIGYSITYVQNFTDVDDKLIRKAADTGMSVTDVADKFIAAYYEDARGLGIQDADAHPRVTEHIPEIIAFIQGLEEKGYAYESGGDVYFRTAKFADYGKLSHQDLSELQFGKRIEVDERKEHPEDFVLWKQAKSGEIAWQSPWGLGRPGWHIECSTMAAKLLGMTIDIHGGGHDLQFPHHECEVAQSEALHDKPLANYWMHNGYVHIRNEKMSKSLGNSINVKDLLRTYTKEALRYFMLSAHYRNPLNFNEETMKQAEQAVSRIATSYANVRHRLAIIGDGAPLQASAKAATEADELQRLEALRKQFHDKMRDDFNTPDAITAMFDLVSEANTYLQREQADRAVLSAMLSLYGEMNDVLGILSEANGSDANGALLDEEIDRLIQERSEARKARNWARADEIRDMLHEQGIVLEDTPQGIRWRRK